MENPQMIQKESQYLTGLSFYGDPFAFRMEWNLENEIGQLWTRYFKLLSAFPEIEQKAHSAGVTYEIHVFHPETPENGKYEVFIGTEISELEEIPPLFLIKHLPAHTYLSYILRGNAIIEDFNEKEIAAYLKERGYQRDAPYHLLVYDERFLGMDQLHDSLITIWIPVSPL